MKDDNTVIYITLGAENDSLVKIAVTQPKTPVLPLRDPFWQEDRPQGLGRACHFPFSDVKLFACFLENPMIQQSGNTLWRKLLQFDRMKISFDSESTVNSSSDENQAWFYIRMQNNCHSTCFSAITRRAMCSNSGSRPCCWKWKLWWRRQRSRSASVYNSRGEIQRKN